MILRKLVRWTLVLMFLLPSIVNSQHQTVYADEGPVVDLRYEPNEDGTIFIEGVATDSAYENVRLQISTLDVNAISGKSEHVSLYEAQVMTNKNGYFSVTTLSIDPSKVKNDYISISFYNERGKESTVSPGYPLAMPNLDTSHLYEDPDYIKVGPFDKFKDGYTPPVKNEIDYTQYGVGTAAPTVTTAKQIKQIVKPVSVAASNTHVIVLTADGTIYGWGDNLHNEIKDSVHPVLPVTKINKLSNVVKVGAGERFSLYLTKQGELYGWGDLNYLGIKIMTGTPQKITLIPETIKDLSVYGKGVVLLTNSGNVYQLGGAGGTGMKLLKNHHRKINIRDVVDVTIGDLDRAYAVKKDGTVWYWNTNMKDKETTATPMQGFKNIKKISSAGDNGPYLIALDKKGNLWAWGDNTSRRLGFNVTQKLYKPLMINRGPIRLNGVEMTYPRVDLAYKAISAGDEGALVVTVQNEMLFMGYGAGTVNFASTEEARNSYKNVSLIETSYKNMYWVSNGKLWVAGYRNEYGQLGFGVKL
ncbi:hypothetical protein [Paenibacillus xylanexedens]|uniref:RCC1 domain-containing protein n=1 Tax=Paenibacillus xylanexedens TaxID=528191 RepID=UPI0028EA7368|nr:hypothetical protein [Paenibacillus xylanexedens]